MIQIPSSSSRNLRFAVRLLIPVLSLTAAGAANAQVFLSETFEPPAWSANQRLTSTAVLGWTGNDNNNPSSLVVQTKTTTAFSGTQSLYLRDGSGSSTPNATTDWGTNIGTLATGPSYFEFSFRNADITTGSGNFAVTFISTAGSGRNFGFTWSDTAGIRLVDATGAALKTVAYAAAGYDATSWNTFRINFSEETNTASVSLNGASIAGLTINSGEANAVFWQAGKVQFTAGSNSAFGIGGYFDSITAATAIPEPSSWSFLFGSAAIVGAISRRRRC